MNCLHEKALIVKPGSVCVLDWDLIGFFCALFVVIYVMEHAAVLQLIGTGVALLIGLGDMAGTASLMVSAAGISSVTDNIPLAAMLANE